MSSALDASGSTVTRTFHAVWVVVTVVAILLACTLSLVCYLTALSITSPKCAGQYLLEGHPVSLSDLLALPLFGAFAIFMIAKIGRDPRTRTMLGVYDLAVFEFARIRITMGMSLIYGILFGLLLCIGVMNGHAGARYVAVSNYCDSNGATS